ncbi:MAG: L-threonylcarbamoyladenylate synthase [Actinomycetota bacterium]
MSSMYKAERIDLRGGRGPEAAERVASLLREGRVGVVPTDTVYGIAACALDREAVGRVMEIKARPADRPLPLHVPGVEEASRLAITDGPEASALMEAFWPGALTLVLPRRKDIELPFQWKESVGLRVPDNRFMLDVLDLCWPLAVPSANPPGEDAPRSGSEVVPSILEAVEFVVEAGLCDGGVESTVVDLTGSPRVLREGALGEREIREALGGP